MKLLQPENASSQTKLYKLFIMLEEIHIKVP